MATRARSQLLVLWVAVVATQVDPLYAQTAPQIPPAPPQVGMDWSLGQQPVQPPFFQSDEQRIGARFSIPAREPRHPTDVNNFVEGLDSFDGTLEVVIGQGRLVTLRKELAEAGKPSPLVAVGDPSIVNFEVVGARHIRLIGQRLGITDLSILTADEKDYNLRVHVIADLEYLTAQLHSSFPEASLELSHLREHVVVKGQARDSRQVTQIITAIQAYLNSIQTRRTLSGTSNIPPPTQQTDGGQPQDPQAAGVGEEPLDPYAPPPAQILPEAGRRNVTATFTTPEIINLIRVPGPQQVLLKVQVAELNRTALRESGVSFLFQDRNTIIGSNISGGLPPAGGGSGGGTAGMSTLLGLLNPLESGAATAFGVFDSGETSIFINALRQNQVFKILAEPNLVALNGQVAQFLSGGQFPVLIPQPSGGAAGLVTVQFKNFGVQLQFVPYILDDKTIRLAVAPEVSSLDFATGVTIVGTTVPGLNTRSTSTVVEIKEGQTLAISGILQQTVDGTTSRLPILGDIPYLGPLFSRNSTQTTERELVILVTPYLVEGMHPDQVPPLPGDDVQEPTDAEFYLKNRIERRVSTPYRATASWDDPLGLDRRRQMEAEQVIGVYGYSR